MRELSIFIDELSAIVGLEVIPAIVKNCNDDEATIIMVDANIQRCIIVKVKIHTK